eukprot:1162006-Pelagomonas_calceolata.AAC.4
MQALQALTLRGERLQDLLGTWSNSPGGPVGANCPSHRENCSRMKDLRPSAQVSDAQVHDPHAWILHGWHQRVPQGQKDRRAGFKRSVYGYYILTEERPPDHLQSHHQAHHHQQQYDLHQQGSGLSMPMAAAVGMAKAKARAPLTGLGAIQLHQQRQWHQSAQQQQQQQQQQQAIQGPEMAQGKVG